MVQDMNYLLKEENIFKALLDPNRDFKTDEINFKLCPEKISMFAEKEPKISMKSIKLTPSFS